MFRRFYHILFVTLLPLVVACSDDGSNDIDTCSPVISMRFSGGHNIPDWTPLKTSRADGPIDAVPPMSVGVWGFNDVNGEGELFSNREVFNPDSTAFTPDPLFAGDVWPYEHPEYWSNSHNYKFFAYGPYISQTGTVLSQTGTVLPSGRSLDNFSKVIWSDIRPLCKDDYVAANSILEYTARPSGNDIQRFTLTHLMARLRLCFKLGERYSDLRVIHVKEIYIKDKSDRIYKLTISYSKNGAGVYVPSYTWESNSVTPGPDQLLALEPLWAEDGYLELKKSDTDFQPAASLYVLPDLKLESLDIKVVYDVFDTTMQLLRLNDEANSTIYMSNVPKLRSGYYYDVNITVEPKYLYALSDLDPDADGFIVIKENSDNQ